MRPLLPKNELRRVTAVSSRAGALERRFDPTAAGTAPRMSWGCVYNDGGTDDVGSSDWECTWDSANGYTIVVTPAFNSTIKVVLLTPSNNNPPGGTPPEPYFAVADANSALDNTFYVYVYDSSGSPADGGFAFLAIEDA